MAGATWLNRACIDTNENAITRAGGRTESEPGPACMRRAYYLPALEPPMRPELAGLGVVLGCLGFFFSLRLSLFPMTDRAPSYWLGPGNQALGIRS